MSHLIKFIQNKLGYRVTDMTESFDNAGISGLDAIVFFEDFSAEFEVDMSAFDFNRYFSITISPFSIFKYWGKRKDFTFHHLEQVIKRKEWFDQEN